MSTRKAYVPNLPRMQRTLEALSSSDVGGTAGGGVDRPALSDADKAVRDLFASMLKERGLEVRVDEVGSMYGRRAGTEPDADPVLVGSHLDTVSPGGRFDGILGVVAALEAVQLLDELGIRTRRPIDVVSWTGEEGARFPPAMLASGVVAGEYGADFVYSRSDPLGRTFGEELSRIGYQGDAASRPARIHASLELHIEQGTRLEDLDVPVGVVSGVDPVRWYEVTVQGRGEHAGGPGLRHRRDSVVAASRMIVAARDIAVADERFTSTVGIVSAAPGSTNVVANTTTFSLDMRAHTDAGLDDALGSLQQAFHGIANEERVGLRVEETWRLPATTFDPALRSQLMRAAAEDGITATELTGTIGHDSLHLSKVTRAAMLFTPTVNGLSHCEAEDTPWVASEQAVAVLTRVLSEVADEA
ncbi:MAG: M20 family metallo-hydrolase [Actinomycetes bacterium]